MREARWQGSLVSRSARHRRRQAGGQILRGLARPGGENWNTPAGRDIVWRSRSNKAPDMLVKMITDKNTDAAQKDRYMRALDFIKGPEKEAALLQIATGGL